MELSVAYFVALGLGFGLAVGEVLGFGVVLGVALGFVDGVGVGVMVEPEVPGTRTPKVGTPGPIALTARTRIKSAALVRATV